MSGNWKRFAIAAACLAAVATAPAGARQSLVFTSIDFPGATLTNAQGINARGDIVGFYNDAGTPSRTHGFLLSGSQFQSIDFPGARATAARGIGPDGAIVGTYVGQFGPTTVPAHGFLLNRGEFSPVDFPGHINTIPQRILADGTILGCYHDTDMMGTMHGMSYSPVSGWDAIPEGMSMHNGATPDGTLIVGLFTDMDNRGKGYFIDRGQFVPFEVPGAISTAGWDINQAGVAVGIYRDAAGFHGFRYDGESFTAIDVPGATATRVFGINARGDMVGSYVDANGRTHGFLAAWVGALKG